MLKEKKLKNPNLNPHVRKIMKPVRYNSAEFKEVMEKAHLYTGGNVSRFIRIASLAYRPTKKELAK